MNTRAFVTTAFIALSLAHNAEAQDDFLTPAEGYFTSYTHIQQYYPRVNELLVRELGQTPVARVVVLPSFSPEYVLSVEAKDGKPTLYYRKSAQQIWSARANNSTTLIPVETSTVPLSPEAAKAIGNVFNRAVDQVHYPTPASSMRGDGTTYQFQTFRNGIGLRGGKTWSPAKNTTMAAMVELVEELRKLATNDSKKTTEAALIAQANALAAKLN